MQATPFCLVFNPDRALRRIIRGRVAEWQQKEGAIAYCFLNRQEKPGLAAGLEFSKKPRINVNGASASATAEQVKCCPSAALIYELVKKAE
jgi:uncharacterized Fe-S cluster protein YjdI